jgi:hypothetical protein
MLLTMAVLAAAMAAAAQTPTGGVTGIVSDPSGAVVPGVRVTVTNRETRQARVAIADGDGRYAVVALPAGRYGLAAEIDGFKRVEREATVQAGITTNVDVTLEIGSVTESVTAVAALPLLHHDDHEVSGVVTREQIEALPLNGRNFLDLAKLEPGVGLATRGTNNRLFLPMLDSGLQSSPRIGSSRVTVDGASAGTIGAPGTVLQVSQEVVQEFQIATMNFTPATSLTTNGSINIVTRSGGNEPHGTGVLLYRDHQFAAYPGLRRDSSNPDPFFRRVQAAGAGGGPFVRNRAFVFASYERNNQDGVVSVQPGVPEFAALGGIFPSPYRGNQASVRVDQRVGGNGLFARETFDGNSGFAPLNGNTKLLPSAWTRTTNTVNQILAGLTAVLSPAIVNDFRASHLFLSAPEHPASASDCPPTVARCVGTGGPTIMIPDASISLGRTRELAGTGHRVQLTDRLTWQHGTHQVGFGGDWEHTAQTSGSVPDPPASLTLWAPSDVSRADATIALPASFTTLDDILQLPLNDYLAVAGPSAAPQRNFSNTRVLDLVRAYASDTWRVRPGLTINGGLAWSYEPNALNVDLSKPALLAPILGADNLGPPTAHQMSVSPSVGFAWTPGRDGRTVVRSGVGRYFDPLGSTNSVDLGSERTDLMPLGTTRVMTSGVSPLCTGTPLLFQTTPTAFRGADLMPLLPAIYQCLLASVNTANRDFSVRTIDRTKSTGSITNTLFDPSFAPPSAIHVGLGIQRQLANRTALSADFVLRRFSHTILSGIDYNHYFAAGGPVIPVCTGAAERNDVRAVCSTGPIAFDNSDGRAQYAALLLRLEKRLGGGTQLLVSYSLASYEGTNGVGGGGAAMGGLATGFSNNNWTQNYGPLPTDVRHTLNVSGTLDLPSAFQVAVNFAASSAPPFSVYVGNVDFDGDGTKNDLLPGTTVNQFGRGATMADLAALVAQYNAQRARWNAQPVTLPDHYEFNDSFCSADIRLMRSFRRSFGQVQVFAEVFNAFNTANLSGYSGDLTSTATFGQPTSRFSQVFGTGGPRAGQVGARLTF